MRYVPPTNTTISRRLFPGRNLWARFTMSTLPLLPDFQLELTSSHQFDRWAEDEEDNASEGLKADMRPPSLSGFASGVLFWTAGVTLNGVFPGLVGQCGLHFAESGLRVKTAVNFGLMATKVTRL